MELNNEFTIDLPIADTWRVLTDLEFIAPCMPGAQLQEVEGDEYRGVVKIKVGPITASYAGKARFVEQNESAGIARLKAEGRDPRQGNANALVTATMTALSAESTNVAINTDLSLSGKIASFGRGAIEDVSKKLLTQFTENLREKLEAEGAPGTVNLSGDAAGTASSEAASAQDAGTDAGSTASVDTGSGDTRSGDTGGSPASHAHPEPTDAGRDTAEGSASAAPQDKPADVVRKIEAPEPEPVDILAVSGDSLIKRLAPVLGVVLTLIIVRLLWKRRG